MAMLEQVTTAMATAAPETIRNICLIAHVDHGKTSFADSLITANAIISNRMAGKLRYMDSRDDEQLRGITMKASGVSLLCGPMLVNLMDSPGHVDFSSEVTSALLLSDVALLLVDVIEGVCSQTQSYLRQAITNGQAVVLVINKLDRLRVELKMSAGEATEHLRRLIEGVNGCVGQILQGVLLEDDSWGCLEELEAKMHFDPNKGNVIFSSAIHSWAFGCDDFAEMYAEKLKMDRKELAGKLFGDYYLAGGVIKEDAIAAGRKCVFEQLVMEPLWQLHDCGLVDLDVDRLIQMAGKLGIVIKTKRVTDAFEEAMRQWLPLPKAALRAVGRCASAKTAFAGGNRLEKIAGPSHPLRDSLTACSPEGVTIALVAKFMRTDGGKKMAIVRVFSGVLRPGAELLMLGKRASQETRTVRVERVWMLRGREVLPLTAATAGVVCAVEADGLVQNATLCSEAAEEGLSVGQEMGEPLVRVTISPRNLEEMDNLREALKLLAVLDPSLRVLEQEDGELAMVTAGEVHLQKCCKDLADLGMSGVNISEPIVPFLETVVADPAFTLAHIQEQVTECRLKEDALVIRLRIVPLSEQVVAVLEKHADLISAMRRGLAGQEDMDKFRKLLKEVAVSSLPALKGSWWYKQSADRVEALVDKIWAFGPERAKSNIMFNAMDDYARKSLWDKSCPLSIRPLDASVVSGWELFAGSGPLCQECMRGVAVVVEEWKADEEDSTVTGQMIPAMKQTCRVAAEKQALRLVAAMYSCVVNTASQALGKVHTVLAQRKAKVLYEDIDEATGLFAVTALLPVVESFGFCESLRKRTSGLASGQLTFSHWQIIDEDPHWVPTTEEEMEEYGVKGDSPNHARGYMDAVRRRKGLPTDDVLVVSAEKQRNLKKNK